MGSKYDRRRNSPQTNDELAKQIVVYALIGPDSVVRYFGVTTKSLSQRLSGHISESRKSAGTRKKNWIRSVLASGHRPRIVRLESCGSRAEAYEIECFLIFIYRLMGANLVNGTEGGEGVHDVSGEAAKKIGDAHRGKKVSDLARQRMSESGRLRSQLESMEMLKNHPIRQLPRSDVALKRRQSLIVSGKRPEFISKMRAIGTENIASLPKSERVRRFTAPSKMLEQVVYNRIVVLKLENPLWSLRKIAVAAGTNHHTVKRCLVRHELLNEI